MFLGLLVTPVGQVRRERKALKEPMEPPDPREKEDGMACRGRWVRRVREECGAGEAEPEVRVFPGPRATLDSPVHRVPLV